MTQKPVEKPTMKPSDERILQASYELIDALAAELTSANGYDRKTAEQRLTNLFSAMWNEAQTQICKRLADSTRSWAERKRYESAKQTQ